MFKLIAVKMYNIPEGRVVSHYMPERPRLGL
jgi:hypothetical protein